MSQYKGKESEVGKAFEYACLRSLYERYCGKTSVLIDLTKPVETAKVFFQRVKDADPDLAWKLETGAGAGISRLEDFEPRLQLGSGDLHLSIQSDDKGKTGDVRDIICCRPDDDWEIGISCKHNNEAVKHSRLSSKIDFGEEWVGHSCSGGYFSQVEVIFAQLASLKAKKTTWSSVPDKQRHFYAPVMEAFRDEMKAIFSAYPDALEELILYLVGRRDFYKIISNDGKRVTTVQAINLRKTLCLSAGENAPRMEVPKLKLPTRYFYFDWDERSDGEKSETTMLLVCDQGWEITFRIHSASTIVEPSLKLDIQLVSTPRSLFTQSYPW